MTAPDPFDAWALPPGVPAPDSGASDSFEEEGLRVRALRATPGWVGDLCARLRAAAGPLRDVPVAEVASALGRVGDRFLDPDDPLRARALALLPATSGLSPEMAAAVLDGMASDWTGDRLHALLDAELDDPGALDRFVGGPVGRVRALGPALTFQSVSGSVPGVGATALLRSLLVKAPILVKPGRGDVVLPVLAAGAVARTHPALARAVAVVYWPGGSRELEDRALAASDVAVAYGGDEAVGDLRRRCPVTTRFVGYHHRISVGAVGREALAPDRVVRTASEVAGAVALFDQRGCVSPQVVFVEEGGAEDPRAFARRLAGALGALEERLPGGRLDLAEGSALHQLRGTAELLAAVGPGGLEVHHGGDASWTVIHDPDPAFGPTCVGRVVRVQPVGELEEVGARIRPLGTHLQTVGLAGAEGRAEALAEAWARAGVSRVAGFSAVPFPPPWWHHDGRGPLEVLLRWVDREGG